MMTDVNRCICSVKQYLTSQFMYTDDEWLSSCVEFLLENNTSNHSESEIQNLAKEQWFLNDLKDICPGSLPKNLKNITKTELLGMFILQVNSAIDIGTPAFQQYLKLQKINTENIDATTKFEDKVPSNRMIKLYLTDGVQDISAIEYKPMRNLSSDITPGCKILIKGPIICRRGVLLLTEDKIQFLGGEVQEIAISNSLPGLLSTKLGVTISQATNLDDTGQQNLDTSIQPRNTNIPPPSAQMPSFTINDEQPKPIARVASLQVSNFVEDDIDLEQLADIEAQYINIDATNKRPLKEDYGQSMALNPEKKPKVQHTFNRPEDYPDDCDIICDDDEDYLKEIEAEFDNKLKAQVAQDHSKIKTVSSEPFVYIKQINQLDENEKIGRVFIIKGQILKLLSKLTVSKESWSLKCTLIDGTGNIDADFTSDVLTKLVGYSPNEMIQLKKEIMTKPDLKEKAVMALQQAKETLQVLYCIIELTILDTPKITKLIPFEQTHANLLRSRFNATGL